MTKKVKEDKVKDKISLGTTLLNLAFSGKSDGGIEPGTIVNMVGTSKSGKTFLVLSILADIANNPKFNDYRLIFDDAEFRNNFNMIKLFGTDLQKRLEVPFPDCTCEYSATIEDLKASIYAKTREGRSYIYILDSVDGLTAESEEDKSDASAEKILERKKNGKESTTKDKGTMVGMIKAKEAHALFRSINNKIVESGSILILISQAKWKVKTIFPIKTRACETALEFFSSVVIWLS